MGESGPHLRRFLETTGVLNPNGISIGSAVLTRLTVVTDATDHTTRSVTIGRVYVYGDAA